MALVKGPQTPVNQLRWPPVWTILSSSEPCLELVLLFSKCSLHVPTTQTLLSSLHTKTPFAVLTQSKLPFSQSLGNDQGKT